jgi:hypothetical protein
LLSKDELTDLLAQRGVSNKDKLLLVLAQMPEQPQQVSEIKKSAIAFGLREAKKWNVSDYFAKAKPLVALVSDGWQLTKSGKEHLEKNFPGSLTKVPGPAAASAAVLRSASTKIKDHDTKAFVEEAIGCLEHGYFRAAVILSWVGAISLLQQHTFDKHLPAFNADAPALDKNWKQAVTKDDLSSIKESTFLDVLGRIKVLHKNVKEQMKNTYLGYRNSCGHPTPLQLGETQVAAHVEFLCLNIFAKFS